MPSITFEVKLPDRSKVEQEFELKPTLTWAQVKTTVLRNTIKGSPDSHLLSFGKGDEILPKHEGQLITSHEKIIEHGKSSGPLRIYLVPFKVKGKGDKSPSKSPSKPLPSTTRSGGKAGRRGTSKSAKRPSIGRRTGSPSKSDKVGNSSKLRSAPGRRGSGHSSASRGSSGRHKPSKESTIVGSPGSLAPSSAAIESGYMSNALTSNILEEEEQKDRFHKPDKVYNKFPVRVNLPTGTYFIMHASGDWSVKQMLKRAFPKIRAAIDVASVDVVRLAAHDDPHTDLQDKAIITHLVYVQERLDSKDIPVFYVSVIEGKGAKSMRLSAYASGNAMASRKGGAANNYTSFRQSGMSMRTPAAQPSRAATKIQTENDKALTSTQVPIEFHLPDGSHFVLKVDPGQPLELVKRRVHLMAKDRDHRLKGIETYLFKLPGEGEDRFLTNQKVLIKDSDWLTDPTAKAGSGLIKLTLVEKKANHNPDKREKLMQMEVGRLIGTPLVWTTDEDEIRLFKTKMWRIREKEKTLMEKVPMQSNLANINIEMKSLVMSDPPSHFTIKILTGDTEAEVEARPDMTVIDVINKIHKSWGKKKIEDHMLKVVGSAQYMEGYESLMSYDHVVLCLQKSKPIRFQVVSKDSVKKILDESSDLYLERIDEEQRNHKEMWFDHKDVSVSETPPQYLKYVSVWDMPRAFRIRIIGVENLNIDDDVQMEVYVSAGLYHGGECVGGTEVTLPVTVTGQNPRFNQHLTFNRMKMQDLPRAARICFTVWAKEGKDRYALGWVNCQLIDHRSHLRAGLHNFNLWEGGEANPIGTCVGNVAANNPATLYVEFDKFPAPVVFPRMHSNKKAAGKIPEIKDVADLERLNRIVKSDPLYRLSEREKKFVWSYRHYVKTIPHALSKFLQSVNWNDRLQVEEAHRLLHSWTALKPVDALELLDSKYADAKVREFAIYWLEKLSDAEVSEFLLQLVQVLKYEPYHDSPLSRFLVKRALRNRLRIGHALYWHLKAELHVAEVSERYGLLLEQYLRGCGGHRKQLDKQNAVLEGLIDAAMAIKSCPKEDRLDVLHAHLQNIQFPASFQLPLRPNMRVGKLIIEKCKYMSSKKLPLWLVFENADPKGSPIYAIFKAGDDLRQDALTLQMLRVMQNVWQKEGLDLRLNPYGCVACGDEIGFIEVVMNSTTTAQITNAAGGAQGAFREDPIDNWLRKENPEPEAYEKAKENFLYSCAGYCVGTYVLGIGDRHNDNVMITRDGHLFHIDFGHFLGNFKKKLGIKRETAPFVFTPDFAYVLGGKQSPMYQHFVDVCCKAYNVLRKHSHMFINLFAMMLSTGIPELQKAEDIEWLKKSFVIGKSDEEAAEHFKGKIKDALGSTMTKMNNAIHILAHKKNLNK